MERKEQAGYPLVAPSGRSSEWRTRGSERVGTSSASTAHGGVAGKGGHPYANKPVHATMPAFFIRHASAYSFTAGFQPLSARSLGA